VANSDFAAAAACRETSRELVCRNQDGLSPILQAMFTPFFIEGISKEYRRNMVGA
jgi:hypothetical protein